MRVVNWTFQIKGNGMMMSLLSPVQQDGVDYKRIVSYSSVFTEVHLFTN